MSRAEPERIEPRTAGAAAAPKAAADTAPKASAAGGDSGGEAHRSLIKSTGSVAVATLLSRITGFVRTVLLAAILGPAIASTFVVANQMPQQISELVVGQVLAALVVPVLVRAEMEDSDRGQAFFERLLTMALTVLGVALVGALLISPFLVGWLVGDSKVNQPLTQALVYLLLPQLLFYGLSALFTAVLNVRGSFRPGAWAPVLANAVQISTLVLYFLMPGELTLNPVRMSEPKLLVLGIGSTLGILLQACIQIPALRRVGIRFRLRWGIDDRLRRFGGMGVAIVLYVAISIAGTYVATPIAAQASASGPTIYQYAWLVLQLPYGVIGVALLTAIMPRLSRNAASGNREGVLDDLSVATRLTMVGLIPVVAFTTVFGPSIGRALFNFGNMDVAVANHLGTALSYEAFVLIPYAMVLIHLRVFYAQEKPWTPNLIILVITGVKIGLSYLAPHLARDGFQTVELLGTATGLAFTAGAVMGWILLRRSFGRMQLTNVRRVVLQTTLVSALAAVTVYAVLQVPFLQRLDKGGPFGALCYLALAGILTLTLIYSCLALLKVPDVLAILSPLRRIAGRFLPALRAAEPPEIEDLPESQARAQRTERQHQRAEEVTAQLPRIADDIHLPYAGQSHIPRRSDPRDEDSSTGLRYRRRGAFAVTQDDSRPSSSSPETGRMRLPSDAPRPADTPPYSGSVPAVRSTPSAPEPMDAAPRGPQLIPGAVVAGGRYRLTEHHGGIRGLQFWQARDINLERDVALTFVDSEQLAPLPERGEQISMRGNGPQSILSRTLRLGRVHTNGLARVLDVVRGSSGGIVVAEWIPSSSLADVAGTEPSAIGAAKAVRALAGAAESAHRAGAALSIDHPDRVRISQDGHAYLAFPGTPADADKESDVRGLGAVLYTLLLQHWPLDAASGRRVAVGPGEVAGIPLAVDAGGGVPIEPRNAKRDVPFEISAVATRTLEGGQGIRTAATVQQLLDQASVVDVKTDLIKPIRITDDDTARAADRSAPRTINQGSSGVRPSPARRLRSATDSVIGEGETKRRNVPLLVAAVCAVVLVVIIGAWALFSVFFGNSDPQSGAEALYPSAQVSTGQVAPPPTAPGVGTPIKASSVDALELTDGGSEPAAGLQNVLTGESPAWRTFEYRSAQFGNVKPGMGLLFSLDRAAALTGGTIISPSAGTRVEIRTATTDDIDDLDETTEVWSGALRASTTSWTVDKVPPKAEYVLLWITSLAGSDGEFQATINQVTFAGN